MKKLSILTTPAVALGVGVLCAPQALAAGYTLSQTNLDAAAGAAGVNTNGIFCDDGGGQFCTLSEGEWTQDGNINLGAVEIGGNPITSLVLQNNVTITNSGDSTITGAIDINDVEVTLTDLNVTGSVNVSSADAEVTINGGTYTADGIGGALNVNNAKTVNISDATFAAGGASAAYVGGGDINITSGTFTSEGDNGIEFFGFNSLNISGGTFSGAASGIAFDGAPAAGTVSLTGGTFTGTGANGKAIWVFGNTDESTINGMVASGYHFTNDTIESSDDPLDNTYIAGTTKVLRDGESEEESEEETTNSTTSTKKSGLGAPDTGVYTAEEGSASSSPVLAIVASVIVALFGAVLVKKNSKRA